MKLNTRVSLLASALTLAGAMFATQANAAYNTARVDINGDPGDTHSIVGGSYSFATSLVDGDVLSLRAANASAGTHAYDTFFSVASTSTADLSALLSAKLSGLSYPLTDTTNPGSNPVGGSVAIAGTQVQVYEYTGLNVGDTYKWEVTGAVSAPTGSSGSQLTVNAVAEPAEWTMLLVSVGLVSYQMRRKQKALSQFVTV